MRFMVYNIAYGTGSPGGEYKRLWQAHRYLAAHSRHFLGIREFIAEYSPDVIGLVEADSGSLRTRGMDQVDAIAGILGYDSHGGNKYSPGSLLSRMPYFRKHSNALLGDGLEAADETPEFFSRGAKRLVISARCGGVRFVLVHLALKRSVRAVQIAELADLVADDMPTVVAGDFNTFGGAAELETLLKGRNWRSANRDHLATYPSWKPRRELDYILYSSELELAGFFRPAVELSDHLPLIADFA